MALDFKSIANKKLSDIERPPLIPVGTYLWMISKLPETTTSPDEKWDYVDFTLKCVAPTEEVDQEQIAAFGDITKVTMRHRFIFDKNDKAAFDRTQFNLRRFLEEHVKCATPDMGLGEAMNASINNQVLASIVWRPDRNDAEVMFVNIGRTAPVA